MALLAVPALINAQSLTPLSTPDNGHGRKLWIASLCAVAGASAFDAFSSWGKQEGNGFLASGNGTFGVKGISIKAGLFTGLLIPQYRFRHRTEWRRRFIIENFVEAGAFGGIAAHNMQVH